MPGEAASRNSEDKSDFVYLVSAELSFRFVTFLIQSLLYIITYKREKKTHNVCSNKGCYVQKSWKKIKLKHLVDLKHPHLLLPSPPKTEENTVIVNSSMYDLCLGGNHGRIMSH